MDLPPRLGLGTIYIAPLCEVPVLLEQESEFRYWDGKVLGIQPHPICGSASSHCVSHPNSIKESSNLHLSTNLAFTYMVASLRINHQQHVSLQA